MTAGLPPPSGTLDGPITTALLTGTRDGHPYGHPHGWDSRPPRHIVHRTYVVLLIPVSAAPDPRARADRAAATRRTPAAAPQVPPAPPGGPPGAGGTTPSDRGR